MGKVNATGARSEDVSLKSRSGRVDNGQEIAGTINGSRAAGISVGKTQNPSTMAYRKKSNQSKYSEKTAAQIAQAVANYRPGKSSYKIDRNGVGTVVLHELAKSSSFKRSIQRIKTSKKKSATS